MNRITIQPAATNPSTNRFFEKLGVPIEKTYHVVPFDGDLPQDVNRYDLKEAYFQSLCKKLTADLVVTRS